MYISRFSKRATRRHNNAQFEIHTIESFLKEMTDGDLPLIFDNSYSMMWIEQGFGEMSIDLQKLNIDNDTVYYVKPGQAFNLEINENAVGFVISFKMEFIELYEKKSFELINTVLFNHFLTLPVIKINKDLNSFMRSVADEMLQNLETILI